MMRRLFVSLVVVLVLALCGGLIWFNFFRQQIITEIFATMTPPAQVVAAEPVEAVIWEPGITAIGTARAANGVELAVETEGFVRAILFTATTRVEAGQPLIQLDDALDRADLIAAESDINLAQTQLNRSSELLQRGTISQSTFDTASAELSTARSRLARIQANLDKKTLKAPFTGVIGIARIDLGAYVTPGTVIATLQDLDTMKVDFTVPERYADALSLDQVVRFGLSEDALDLEGRIVGIDPRIDPETRLISVQGLVANNEGRLLPGRFVHVRIEQPREDGIVAVPQTAVMTSLYGDYVYRIEEPQSADEAAEATEEQRARQVFVRTGRRNGSVIEVLSGLEPGDLVVTAGQNKLQPGAAVTVDNSVTRTQAADLR